MMASTSSGGQAFSIRPGRPISASSTRHRSGSPSVSLIHSPSRSASPASPRDRCGFSCGGRRSATPPSGVSAAASFALAFSDSPSGRDYIRSHIARSQDRFHIRGRFQTAGREVDRRRGGGRASRASGAGWAKGGSKSGAFSFGFGRKKLLPQFDGLRRTGLRRSGRNMARGSKPTKLHFRVTKREMGRGPPHMARRRWCQLGISNGDDCGGVSQGVRGVVATLAERPNRPVWPGEKQLETTFEKDYTLTRRLKVTGKLFVKVVALESERKIRVSISCDILHNAILHWGVTSLEEAGREWTQPPKKIQPPGTYPYKDYAARTPLRSSSSTLAGDQSNHLHYVDIELDDDDAPEVIPFVLKDEETGRWHDNKGGNFVINLLELLQRKEGSGAENLANDDKTKGGIKSTSPHMAKEKDKHRVERLPGQRKESGAETQEMRKKGVVLLQEEHKLEKEIEITNTLSASVGADGEGNEVKVLMSTDLSGPVILHWGLVKRGEEHDVWTVPPEPLLPPNSTIYKKRAVQTLMMKDGGGDGSWLMLDVAASFTSMRFVLKEVDSNTWFDCDGEDFSMTLPGMDGSAPVSTGIVPSDIELLERSAEVMVAEPVLPLADMPEGGAVIDTASASILKGEQDVVSRPSASAKPMAEVAQVNEGVAAKVDTPKNEEGPLIPGAAMTTPSGFIIMDPRLLDNESTRDRLLQEIDRLAAEAYENFKRASPVATPAPEKLLDRPIPEQKRKTMPLPVPVPVPQIPLPDVKPCPGTGTGRELLLQGFNWESHKTRRWYDIIGDQAADIASWGFTVVWLPPPTESISPEGYMPRDLYNLNSKYGDVEALKRVVERMHDAGLKVLGDAVLNHRCAHFQSPNGVWNLYGGKLNWDSRAIVCDDAHFQGTGNRSSGDSFHAAPNIDHSQDFVRKDITEWMQWLRKEVGYDGWRLDFVRGFWGGYVKDYIEGTNPTFVVGEYWDSLSYTYGEMDYNQDAHRQRIIDWINATGGNAGAFDVTTKGILHTTIEKCEYWRLADSKRKPPGVLGWWPSRAVTFIENHDTGSTQGHWRFPQGKEMLGYVYILTHPGTPTVFYDHLFGHLKETIKALLSLRQRQDLHCRSVVYIEKAEKEVYAARIDDRVLMKIGPGYFNAPSNGPKKWNCVLEGHDFKVWEVAE